MTKNDEIIIYLNDIEEAINVFNPKILSDELNDYILKRCMFIPIKNKIDIIICGIEEKAQSNLKDSIHNHYKELVVKTKKIEQYNDIKRLILLILGVILIFISEMFEFVISELFLVAGWVVIWELVYDIIFERVRRNRDYFKYLQLSKANIKFK